VEYLLRASVAIMILIALTVISAGAFLLAIVVGVFLGLLVIIFLPVPFAIAKDRQEWFAMPGNSVKPTISWIRSIWSKRAELEKTFLKSSQSNS